MKKNKNVNGLRTFRHVGHDDADEEDDCIQPVVAQNEGDEEEGDAQEDGHACDELNEMVNFFGDGGFSSVQT